MNDQPEPLTPPDCDLRAFRDMPLDVGRFRDSDLMTYEDPEAVVAAILLWGSAWHQVPAASLPDDDRVLARLAGYGRAVEAWLLVRDGALRGFVLCRDGRLYNRTLAEKAKTAWDKRLSFDWTKAKDRHRKAQKDLPEQLRTDFPDFDAWLAGRVPAEPVPHPQSELPLERGQLSGGKSSVCARAPGAPARTGASTVPHDETSNSSGTDEQFQRNDPEIPAENALKERKGKGVLSTQPNPSLSNSASDIETEPGRDGSGAKNRLQDADLTGLYEAVSRAAGFNPSAPAQIDRAYGVIEDWRREGIDFDLVVIPTITSMVASSREPTRTLSRFSTHIRHENARLRALGGQARAYRPPETPVLEPAGENPALRPLRAALLKRMGPATYCALLNPVTLEVVDDPRAPLRLRGSPHALSSLGDKLSAGPLLKIIKAHGYKEIWNG